MTTPESPAAAAEPPANQVDDQAKFYQVMQMAKIVPGVERSQWETFPFQNEIADWSDESLYPFFHDKAFGGFDAQEEPEDSAFNEAMSGFTLKHFPDDELFNMFGKYVTADEESPFSGWMVLWPAEASKAKSAKGRMTEVNRRLNSVAFHPETGDLDVFRYDLIKDGVGQKPARMNEATARANFATILNTPELLKQAIESDNRRSASFIMPMGEHGYEVTMTFPWMPKSLFVVVAREAKKAAKEAEKAAKEKEKADKAAAKEAEKAAKEAQKAAAKEAEKAAKAAEKAAVKEKKKAMFKQQLLKPQEEPPQNDVVMKEVDAALDAPQAVPPPPSSVKESQAAAANQKLAVKRKRSADDEGALYVAAKREARRATLDTDLTFANFLSHFGYKFTKDKYTTPGTFRGKTTFGAVTKDPLAITKIQNAAEVIEHLAPHLLGLAPAPEIPEGMEKLDASRMM